MLFRKPFISTLAVLCLLILNPGFAAAQDEETAPPIDTEIQSTDIPAGQEPAPPAAEETAVAPEQDDQKKLKAKDQKAAAAQQTAVQSMTTATTGEVTLGDSKFVAPPTPDNSTFSGSANYKIPIIVPPGCNGLSPSIALTYSSQRGNSWVGVGWDLDIGSIRRSTKRAVDYSKNDFVFSSEGKSYDLVDRSAIWGSYYYGAKAEEDFTQYYRDPDTNNKGWVAFAKDGTKYYYGSTDASRQFSGTKIFQWYLDRVEDTNGNYISIIYTTYPSTDPGVLYPFEIKYTGHISGLQPTNSIKFILETRTDKILSYISHFKVLTTKRLKSIEVRAGSQFVRKYEIAHNYSPSTKRSIVQSVTEYGNDETSTLPPINFTYQDSGPNGEDSFTKLQKPRNWFSGLTASGGKTVHPTTGDQNGDGLDDIYYEAIEESPASTYDYGAFLVSQGDGDFHTVDALN